MKRSHAALNLGFHANPAQNRRRNEAAIILGLVLVVMSLVYYRHLMQSTAQIERDAQLLSHELSQPAAVPVRLKTTDEGGKKLLQQLNVPWEVLLDGLEAAALDKTALLFMQPNIRQGEVVLGGEAARYADVLAYIERLKSQPGFDEAYLTNHEIAEDVPGEPVRFNILLKWGVPE